MNLANHTALVTGASRGLGRSFARLLASLGADLVLTARSKQRLERLSKELRTTYSVEVDYLVLDLGKRGASAKLIQHLEGQNRTIDILINNAASATFSQFLDIPNEQLIKEINLNVIAPTELTWNIARSMKERDRGYVLNVASVSGFFPTPGYSTYAASKAYIRCFTEALAYELHATRVRVMCLSPGVMTTEFWTNAGQHQMPYILKMGASPPERVAWAGLTALFCGRYKLVPGLPNKLAVFLIRFLPSRFLAWICARALKIGQAP